MAQVKNTGRVALPYSGGYILPGRVKDVPNEEIEKLRESGEILVLPTQDATRRPSASESPAVAEPVIPDPPLIEPEAQDSGEDAEVESDEGEDKSERKKKRRRKKKD